MWKDDGSGAVSPGASASEFVVSGAEAGTPTNALFDQSLSSGQYFEVKVLACASSPFVGVTTEAGFGKGWKCKGLFFGGPGNLSSGGALAQGEFGDEVKEGMTIGVHVEYTSELVNVTFYQNARCLGPSFTAPRLSTTPIFPVVHTSDDGDRFSIAFPAEAPVKREREAKGGGKLHPACDAWMLESMTSEGAVVDVGAKMPAGERVELKVDAVGAPADNIFLLMFKVCNTLRVQVTMTPDPGPPHSQEIKECGPVMATRMAGPPEMMEVETTVETLIASLKSWQVDSGKLRFLSKDGQMVFCKSDGEDSLPVKNVDLP